jgi:hypothetical protein
MIRLRDRNLGDGTEGHQTTPDHRVFDESTIFGDS